MMYDMESENRILGSLLINNNLYDNVSDIISVNDFTSTFGKKLYKEIQADIEKGEIVTIQTLSRKFPKLAADIVKLTSIDGSSNIKYYATELKKISFKRQLSKIAEDIKTDIEGTEDPNNTIEKLSSQLMKLTMNKKGKTKRLSEIIPETVKELENNYRNHGATGIETPFPDLNYMIGGFQKGEFIVIGARPSIGKTALGCSFALHIGQKNIPVAFFSLEMKNTAIVTRLLCGNAKVPQIKARRGDLTENDFDRIHSEAAKIYDAPIFIYDQPNAAMSDIRREARKLKRSENIQILFIDYLTLITIPGNMPRWEKFSEVSALCKALAIELDIPVVVLSQLRRDAEGKKPILSDLRESGSIEQDADLVVFLHRERGASETELIVEKGRNCLIGTVNLYFKADETRFYPVSRY